MKQIIILLSFIVVFAPLNSLADKNKTGTKGPNPSASAYEHANDNARFKRDGGAANNEKHDPSVRHDRQEHDHDRDHDHEHDGHHEHEPDPDRQGNATDKSKAKDTAEPQPQRRTTAGSKR